MVTSRASLAAVAALAGVSVSTASRVLSGRGEYAPATRRSVLDAAAELGYDRSSTRRGRAAAPGTRLIEMVTGRLSGAWITRAILSAHERAFALGYDIALTRERRDALDDWPVRVATRRPSGVIATVLTPTARQLDLLSSLAVPIVLLEPRTGADHGLPVVGATDREGGADAGRHLVQMGYERFALVGSSLRYRYGRAREEGFRQALAREDLMVLDAEWSGRMPVATVDRIVKVAAERRVGVFALNDRIANALVAQLLGAGVRVPEEVGVVGFDDDPAPGGSRLTLTSVHQPLREMAARAVDLVDALRRGEPIGERRIELPTELIVRGSTARGGR